MVFEGLGREPFYIICSEAMEERFSFFCSRSMEFVFYLFHFKIRAIFVFVLDYQREKKQKK